MNNIIETNFGKKADLSRIAHGSASNVTKQGSFYVFSIRLSADDVREYSFTNRDRATSMRNVLIGHLEQKFIQETKRAIAFN